MATAKEQVKDLLDHLPDDASMEDIQYHLYVRNKILLSIEEADAGKLIPHEEVEERMKKWIIE